MILETFWYVGVWYWVINIQILKVTPNFYVYYSWKSFANPYSLPALYKPLKSDAPHFANAFTKLFHK